jgi:type IV pilus assembly protein PilV
MRCCAAHAGFSLVEVMVALIVVSVGLLGIAKMQALALASTSTAKMRSLASIEAASLASTMRADRAYWAALTNDVIVNVANKRVVAASDPALTAAAPAQCAIVADVPCTSAQIASQDLSDWASAVGSALPNVVAKVSCSFDKAGANPVTCIIRLDWTENVVALNTSSNAAAAPTQNAAANTAQAFTHTQYTLFVEP